MSCKPPPPQKKKAKCYFVLRRNQCYFWECGQWLRITRDVLLIRGAFDLWTCYNDDELISVGWRLGPELATWGIGLTFLGNHPLPAK